VIGAVFRHRPLYLPERGGAPVPVVIELLSASEAASVMASSFNLDDLLMKDVDLF